MKQILLIFITCLSLIKLSGQNVEYHNIDSPYHILDSLIINEVKEELILEQVDLLLKLDTCNAYLFTCKGWCYQKKGDYETAKKFYIRAITLDSLQFESLYYLGSIYHEEKEYETAKYFYFRTIALDSLHFEALYGLGALYYNEGVKEMDTTLGSPKSNKEVIEKFAIGYNKFYLSKVFFDRAFAINPDIPELIKILDELKHKRNRIIERWIVY